jgi:hypothetical protein
MNNYSKTRGHRWGVKKKESREVEADKRRYLFT